MAENLESIDELGVSYADRTLGTETCKYKDPLRGGKNSRIS